MLNHKKINVLLLALVWLLLVLDLFVAVSWWYYLLLPVLYLGVVATGSSFMQLNFHVKAHCCNPYEKEKKIALTFDDGPSIFTLQVLEILERYNAKAAFFCIGKNIEQQPGILKQVHAAGHIIGNHSYSHAHFFDFYGAGSVTAELQATDALIEKLTGKKPAFFRPPYGVTNPAIRKALAVTKHHAIGWSIRSMDGVSKDEKAIYNRIVRQLKPGAVVLLHDTSQVTVRVLEQLLLFLQANQYQIVRPDGLLNLKAYED